jgi:hypothetical protein
MMTQSETQSKKNNISIKKLNYLLVSELIN